MTGKGSYKHTIIGPFDIKETTFMFIEFLNNLDHADEFYTMKSSIKQIN